MYAGLSHFTWGVVCGWVVLACTKGYGGKPITGLIKIKQEMCLLCTNDNFVITGIINSILSWEAFIPLAKITYTAYLFHWIVVVTWAALTNRSPVEYNYFYFVRFKTLMFLSSYLNVYFVNISGFDGYYWYHLCHYRLLCNGFDGGNPFSQSWKVNI